MEQALDPERMRCSLSHALLRAVNVRQLWMLHTASEDQPDVGRSNAQAAQPTSM